MAALIILILFHLLLLSKTVFFPYPELFVYPYLTDAGLLPYKQIFDQHFPGLMFLPVNFHMLGMTTPATARIWQFGIVAITHLLLYNISLKLTKSKMTALLPNLLYLIWQPYFEGWVLWIDSFIPIFLLSASWIYLTKNKYKFFWAGVLIGIAFVFKQVIAPLGLVIGIFFLIKHGFKNGLYYALGVLVPTLVLVVYIFKLGVWNDFVFWTYTFNVGTFADMGRKHPQVKELLKVIGVFMPGVISTIYFGVKNKWSVVFLGLLLLSGLSFVFARFDYVHLQPSLVFVILLTALLVEEMITKRKTLGLLFLAFYLCGSFFLLTKFYKANFSNRILFYTATEVRLAEEVSKYASKNDSIFAFGTTPHIYALTNTLPPGKIFVFQFPWFMVEAENRVLAGIESDPPKVIIKDPTSTTSEMNLIEYMPKINTYIDKNYKVVNTIENVQILIPR